MSNYEFWDELGKIFNAVVAYQEKNIEFNKRFINPWIRLGNVFDKQDRHREAIDAYHKAIEIDPANAQNWSELGNAYFRAEAYDEASDAFHKAIELDPKLGWPYSNLALTLVTQGKCTEAIPLYQKSIDLLQDDKDKAVAWNRLGNVYRKLNDYEHAVHAFQKADELDEENAGFRDELDEVSEGPSLVEESQGENGGQPTEVAVSPIQLIVEESQAEEAAANKVPAIDPAASSPTSQAAGVDTKPDVTSSAKLETAPKETPQPAAEAVPAAPISEAPVREPKPEIPVTQNVESAPTVSTDPSANSTALGEQTVTVLVQNTVETYTDSLTVMGAPAQTSGASPAAMETPTKPAAHIEEAPAPYPEQSPDDKPAPETSTAADEAEAVSKEALEVAADAPQVPGEAEELAELEESSEGVIRAATEADSAVEPTPALAAYEEFLKDNSEALDILAVETVEETVEDQDAAAQQELVTKIDSSGELEIEMDTKNAHVWNELGNVYFNTGAYDDAIVAYSKAIELDRGFAWPYSNLALAYVQKGRFVEAILLYERSIELFASDKDKAISWNRLGNVHRRLNDYDKAIAAYQRADELDPDNTTLSLQSRFSLLGNYHVEQKPSYVS